MKMINIFQDNNYIRNTIAKTLGYETPQKYSWYTQDIYFETYFYITKRFGFPVIIDDYKKISLWSFLVKDYTVSIELNSSWVTFMVFGEAKHFSMSTYPISWIKYHREKERKKDFLILNTENAEKRSKYENDKLTELLNNFQKEKGFPNNISNDEFNEKYAYEFWFERVEKFNNDILGIDHNQISEKFGTEYYNSKTRHALRTLEQFLNNMLSPIWIRDAPFNIKGRISDKEALYYSRFENNIKIDFITN